VKCITGLFLVSLTANLSVAYAQSNEQIESYERRIDEQQLQLDAMREELEVLKQRERMSSVSPDEPELREVPVRDAGAGRDYEPFVVRRSQDKYRQGTDTLHRFWVLGWVL
jgi:hypothetical protein